LKVAIMSSRRLLILSIAAIVVIGAGFWLAGRQASTRSGDSYPALYPALKKQLDAVTAVRIFKAGDARAVELVRQDSGWTVGERAGYPADTAKLHKLLLGLAEARLYEEKTSKPDQYKSLNVEDVSDPAAGGVRIELAGTAEPVNLIVGKAGPGAQSSYVRRAGEAQSWLVNASIDTSASADAWLRKDILDIAADRIQSAAVSHGAKSYTAAKSSRADADFTVQGLPKGKQLSSPSAANSAATALAGLTLSDVQSASTFDTSKPAAQATFKTFDGLVAQLDGWSREDKHYIAVRTSFDPAVAEQFKVATAPAEEKVDPAKSEGGSAQAAPATAPTAPTSNVAEEAKNTATKLNGWVYELPAYKYEAIFKPVDELLK
jgi:Domain of unknown function (DUF4340)